MNRKNAGILPASDNAAPLRSRSAALRRVGGAKNDVAFLTGFSARGAFDRSSHVGGG